MKAYFAQKKFFLILIAVLIISRTEAQIATWSFNNVLTGTGSANAAAGNASLGAAIPTGNYNGGIVYFGEDGWPLAGIDMNAYLEFSITPSAGQSLTISSLSMQIRRSTTGSSGAGPNTWSLRSNLDGYATDVASGVLSTNSTPATVATLGIAFMNVPSKIIFRLYGYNATISSGGLNRFVYDHIVANGSTVLPVVFDYFNVKAREESAELSWKLAGEGNLSSLIVERAAEGGNFETIKKYTNTGLKNETGFVFTDWLNHPAGNYAYRLQMVSEDGHAAYSSVVVVSFARQDGFTLRSVNNGSSHTVLFKVNTEKTGTYTFSLFNLNGNKVAEKNVQLMTGSQTVEMENKSLKAGIYVLLGENGSQKISTKLMVL